MFKKYIIITLCFSSFTYLQGMELEDACARDAYAMEWEQHAPYNLKEMAQKLAIAKLSSCRTKRSSSSFDDEHNDQNLGKTIRTESMTNIHDSSFNRLQAITIDIYTLWTNDSLFISNEVMYDESHFHPTYSIHPEHIYKIKILHTYLLQTLPPTTGDQLKLLKTSTHLLKFLHSKDLLLAIKLESLAFYPLHS